MLRVVNLVKRYETKGEVVTALNGVSVNFPETGMVFLLGKSGSGKSTLLNVSGGLDTPDSGEVIVKGKSSNDFSPSDFDSYRNTYVGFIFQEYNVLNEFTVKENVALALELQGKPRDEKLVQEILEQVDMADLGDRRPNTLSGGQKQRVAIARALVKNPEIIMADEPTGALDSETGKQVFDTLKKLSENKLVVVVSHDRDFAETYADRIIELKDGSIISDMSREAGTFEQTNLSSVSEKKLAIGCGATLTDEEIEKVCAFLKKGKGKFIISAEEEDVKEVRTDKKGGFSQTKEEEPVFEQNECNFIKSKFPLRHAIKMGLSGLKFKPVRLAFTILLSTIAFIVFGLFSTIVTFNKGKIASSTLYDSAYVGGVVKKKAVMHLQDDKTVYINTGRNGAHFSQGEIEMLQRKYPQMGFIPAFDMNFTGGLDFKNTAMGSSQVANYYYRQLTSFRAFADVSAVKDNSAYTLVAGQYPEKENEVLISQNVYEAFCLYGHNIGSGSGTAAIASYDDMLGKEISLVANIERRVKVKVVGILDTHEKFEAYEYLKDTSNQGITATDNATSELKSVYLNSISAIAFVSSDFRNYFSDFDNANTRDSVEKTIERYKKTYGNTYVGCNYTEPSDAYCQYLIVSLSQNRQEKCNVLMRKLNDWFVSDRDVIYKADTFRFMSEVSTGNKLIGEMMLGLGIASVVLAVFSALLLFNFISASITGKKKDIGILRAVGARGIDVFKIFFAEALTVTTLCFALASIGSLAACAIINSMLLSQEIIAFKVLLFDVLNALFVFAISLMTAVVATVIPVRSAVKKKPVEAIRSL